MKRMVLFIFVVFVVLVFVIQIIPFGRNHTNPPVLQEPNWYSAETRDLAVRACFDCHSNETVWPWYSNIAPISWLVYKDVVEGREHLNFSEWGLQRGEGSDPGEMAEAISEGRMPPAYYLLIHPAARLTDAQKQKLILGLQNTR